MERIRLTASEEMSFENVDGRTTDGRRMPVYTYIYRRVYGRKLFYGDVLFKFVIWGGISSEGARLNFERQNILTSLHVHRNDETRVGPMVL